MRMVHYFLAGALLLAPALLWTVVSGLTSGASSELHFWSGLLTAALAIGVHTLVILFVLITGRVLREAMQARPLGPEFLLELNQFFARRRAYPLAVLSAFSIVAAGVLGNGARGCGNSPGWHWLVGLGAVGVNLWALQEEYRILRENQRLVDRVAAALDAIDRERGELPLEAPPDASTVARWSLAFAVGAWCPYLYWALFEYRGDFSRVSAHPWAEASALALVVWLLALREGRREVRTREARDEG
jgi:hypothetical protein